VRLIEEDLKDKEIIANMKKSFDIKFEFSDPKGYHRGAEMSNENSRLKYERIR
jgi:hypothetical protein